MLGTVRLKGLRIICPIGTQSRERETPQVLRVDLEMDLDLAEAVASENVAATVDYADAAARLEELAQEGRFQLLETYVEEAASMLFEAYPPLEAVRIEAKKPGAVPAADFAAVRIERRREDV